MSNQSLQDRVDSYFEFATLVNNHDMDLLIRDLNTALKSAEKECDELKAHVERMKYTMREVLNCCTCAECSDALEISIGITPEQSLAAHDNEIIDKCAAICEKYGEQATYMASEEILEIKSKEGE